MKITKIKPFGCLVSDVDLKQLTGVQWRAICQAYIENHLIIFRDQDLSAQESAVFARCFGRVNVSDEYFTNENAPEVINVTNRKRRGKCIGLFPDQELNWHSNGTARYKSEPGLMLYCKVPGEGSITSFADCSQAFYDLSFQERERVGFAQVLFKYRNHTYYQSSKREMSILHREGSGNSGVVKPLLARHCITGRKAIYMGYFYIEKIISDLAVSDKWIEELFLHCTKERYVYNHHWLSGDVVIADQLMTIHKRNAVKGDRLLYRLVFYYDNL